MPFEDNSGLSYTTSKGESTEGALIKAEGNFKYLLLPILAVIFALINVFLFYKTFIIRKRVK